MELDKLKKKVKKEFSDNVEVHPDSDLPVREKLTKQKKILTIDDDEDEESKEEE